MNKKLLKKIYFLIFFILLFVFITTSFAAADADGEILKIRELKKPLTLHPIHAVDNISKKISEQIFENLVIINKQGKVEPYLAESWEIKDDGKLIVIKLRD